MALNFPNTPANGDKYVDPTGQGWVYETLTNSWTALGAPTPGMVYKGPVNITQPAPTGAQAGWVFTVTSGGAPHASFTGLTGTILAQSQIIFDGTNWQIQSPPGMWTRTGTTLSPHTAGDKIQGPLVPTNGALGSRNVIINGDLKINQRAVTIDAAAVGAYGPDRWKKVDASHMTQIVEDVNFVPGAKYTLSWKGGTPQVLTAPASGHWTLPNIPITATEIQLELGEVATPFERRSMGLELHLCQRYYQFLMILGAPLATANSDVGNADVYLPLGMATSMRTFGATVTPTAISVGKAIGTVNANMFIKDMQYADQGVARLRLGKLGTTNTGLDLISKIGTGTDHVTADCEL